MTLLCMCVHFSFDVASESDRTPCIKINKPLPSGL